MVYFYYSRLLRTWHWEWRSNPSRAIYSSLKIHSRTWVWTFYQRNLSLILLLSRQSHSRYIFWNDKLDEYSFHFFLKDDLCLRIECSCAHNRRSTLHCIWALWQNNSTDIKQQTCGFHQSSSKSESKNTCKLKEEKKKKEGK